MSKYVNTEMRTPGVLFLDFLLPSYPPDKRHISFLRMKGEWKTHQLAQLAIPRGICSHPGRHSIQATCMVCGTKLTDQNDSLSKQGGHSAMYVALYCMMCGWIKGFISAVCAHSTVEVATPPERSSKPFSLQFA